MSNDLSTTGHGTDFPNRLCASDRPAAPSARRQAAVLGLLLAACFAPRAWFACQQDTICPDAVRYLEIVDSLRRGDSAAFDYLDLNIFPAILLLLQQTGEHWTTACAAWNVLMATLAVLPLYGLIRRQLDERAAILAGLLYAFHPRLVLYSPLILRDPTFWFLFLLSLYLIWRAVTEVRWRLFLAAGAAVFLAIHTRTEGWLLLLPLLIWAGRRFWGAASDSRRLLWGLAACIAVIPALTILINVTLLRNEPQWHGASVRNFACAWRWLRGESDPAADPAAGLGPETGPNADSQSAAARTGWVNHPGRKLNQRLIVRFTKTFTYVYGLMVLAGIWCLRRNPLRSDILPYFLIAGGLMIGVWVRYNLLPIDERYFFTILLVSLPGLALGVLQIRDWIVRLAEVLRARRAGILRASGGPDGRAPRGAIQLRAAVVPALLAVIAAAGVIDGVHTGRAMLRAWREQADLGRWILAHYGPQQRVTGNSEEMRLIAYYCQGELLTFADRRDGARTLFGQFGAPGVVVCWTDSTHGDNWSVCQEVLEHDADLGYRRVPPESLPPSCRRSAVLVRTGEEVAQRGAAGTTR